MRFNEEVLQALLDGKRIRRKCWIREKWIFIKDDEMIDSFDRRIAISVEGLKADDWEIIKEPRKVKLRDLTEEQYDKWSTANCGGINGKKCKNCLFRNVPCASYVDICWLYNKDLYSDKFLDQEIEIDDDDDEKITEIL